MYFKFYVYICVFYFLTSSLTSLKLKNYDVQSHQLARHKRAADNLLRKNGKNVCTYNEAKIVYEQKFTVATELYEVEVCCKKFGGCWKKCKRSAVRTKRVSRIVSKHRTYDVNHCCNGWTVNDKGDECTKPLCYPYCRNNGVCVAPDKCSCTKGFTDRLCQIDINECEVYKPCAQGCINLPGTYQCTCNKGYQPKDVESRTCQGINECKQNPCTCANGLTNCKATCKDTLGSYTCQCNKGYRLARNNLCVDNNECLANADICPHECINTIGSYQCKCFHGYQYINNKCVAKSLCASGNGGCTQECIPYPGGYVCACKNGYYLASDTYQCIDINECNGFNPCDDKTSQCVNTQGGYYCECKQGFIYAPKTFICDDRDECDEKTALCEQGCRNTYGSYQCSCNKGFKLNYDGKTCSDVNECSGGKTKCSQLCVNTIGSYKCACKDGYTLDVDEVTCHAKPCMTLLDPFFGKTTCNGESVGNVCHVTCNKGYELTGSSSRTCDPNGLWSGVETKCLPKVCDVPNPPPYGKISLPCNLSYGSTCPVKCRDGFMLRGEGSIKCAIIHGALKWDTTDVYCEEILVCKPNPCLHQGVCSIITDTRYSCNCTSTGYSGVKCEKLIVSISPIPKIATGTKSVELTLSSKPKTFVSVSIYQEDVIIKVTPNQVKITNSNQQQKFQLQSSKSGLYWLAYELESKDKVNFFPDSLLLFYNEKELKKVVLPGMDDCFKLKTKNPSSGNVVEFTSTGWWSDAPNNNIQTNGVVFINIGSTKFPLVLSKILTSKVLNNFELIRDENVPTTCQERVLTSGEIQYAVKNDLFVHYFIKQFNTLTPAWFNIYLKSSFNNVHVDNIQSYLFTGSRVANDPECNGAVIDQNEIYLIYKHHEGLTMILNEKQIELKTKSVFCFVIDIKSKDAQIVIPSDNRVNVKNFISFDESKQLGWDMNFKSIGFIKNQQKCRFSRSKQQMSFGSTEMMFQQKSVHGSIEGNLFYDIKNVNGKEIFSRNQQCFVGKSRMDTPSWYVTSNEVKKYSGEVSDSKTIQAKQQPNVFSIINDNKSIFKLKSGIKPILLNSNQQDITFNLLYKTDDTTGSTAGDDSSFDKINALMMLQIPVMDLEATVQSLPVTPNNQAFQSLITDWNIEINNDVNELYNKLDDASFINSKVSVHYYKALNVVEKLKTTISDLKILSPKHASIVLLDNGSRDISIVLVDLKKYITVTKKSQELQYVTLNFNANMCLYSPCVSSVNISLYPMNYDLGLKGFCTDLSKAPFEKWTAVIENMGSNTGDILKFNANGKSYMCLTTAGVDKALFDSEMMLFGVLIKDRFIMEKNIIKIPRKVLKIYNKYDFSVNSTLDMRLKDWSMINVRSKGLTTPGSKFLEVLQKHLDERAVKRENKLKVRVGVSETTIKNIQNNVQGLETNIRNMNSKIKKRKTEIMTANNNLKTSKTKYQNWESEYRKYRNEMLRIDNSIQSKCQIKTCPFKCIKSPKCSICQEPYMINKTIPQCKVSLEDRSYGYLKSVQQVCSHIVEDRDFKYTGSCKEPAAEETYAQNVIDRINKKINEKQELSLEDAYLLESVDREKGKQLRLQIEKTLFFKHLQRRLNDQLLTEEDFSKLQEYTNKTFSEKMRQNMKKVRDSNIMKAIARKLNQSEILTDEDYIKLSEIDPQLEKSIRKSQAIAAITEKIQKSGVATEEDLNKLKEIAPEYSANLTKQIEKQEYMKNVLKMVQEKISNSTLQPEDISMLEKVNPEVAEKLKTALKEQLNLKVKEMENKLKTVKGSLDAGFNNTEFKNLKSQLDALGGKVTPYDKATLQKLQDKILANNNTKGGLFEEVFERLDLDYDLMNMTGNSNDLKNVMTQFLNVLPKFNIPLIFRRSPLGILKGLEKIQEWFSMSVKIFEQTLARCNSTCTDTNRHLIKEGARNILSFNQGFCKTNWAVGIKIKAVTNLCLTLSKIESSFQKHLKSSLNQVGKFQQDFVLPLMNVVKAWKNVREEIKELNRNQWQNNVKITSYIQQYQSIIQKLQITFSKDLQSTKLIDNFPASDVLDSVQMIINDVNSSISLVQFEIVNNILTKLVECIEKIPNFLKQNKIVTLTINRNEKQNILVLFDHIANEVEILTTNLCEDKSVKNLPDLTESLKILKEKSKDQLQLLIEKPKLLTDVSLYANRFSNLVKALIITSNKIKSSLLPCKLRAEKLDSSLKNIHNEALNGLKTFLETVVHKKTKTIKDVANNIRSIIGEFKNGISSPVGQLITQMMHLVDNSPHFNIPMILSESPKVSNLLLNSLQDYLVNTKSFFNGMIDILQNCKDCSPQDVFGKDSLKEIAEKLDKFFKPIAKTTKTFIHVIGFTPQGLPLLIGSLQELRTALQTLSISETGFSSDGIENIVEGFDESIDSLQFIRRGLEVTHKSLTGVSDVNIEIFERSLSKLATEMGVLYSKSNGKLEVVRDIYRKIEMYKDKLMDTRIHLKNNAIKRRLQIVREGTDILQEISSSFKNIYTTLRRSVMYSGNQNTDLETYVDNVYIPSISGDVDTLKEISRNILNTTNAIGDLTGIEISNKDSINIFDVDISSKINSLASSVGARKLRLADELTQAGNTIKTKIENVVKGAEQYLGNMIGSVERYFNQSYERVKQKLDKYGKIYDEIKSTMKEIEDKPFTKIGDIANAADELILSLDEYDLNLLLSANPNVIPRKVDEFKVLFQSLGGAMKEIDQILQNCTHCYADRIFGYKYIKSLASKLNDKTNTMFTRLQNFSVKIGDSIGELQGVNKAVENIKTRFNNIFDQNDFNADTFKNLSDALLGSTSDIDSLKTGTENIAKILFNKDIDIQVLNGTIKNIISDLAGVMNKSYIVGKSAEKVFNKAIEIETMFNEVRQTSSQLTNGPIGERIKITRGLTDKVKEMINEFPALLNLSQATLETAGVNGAWVSTFLKHTESLTVSVGSMIDKTNRVLDAANIASEGVKDIKQQVPIIKSSLKKLSNVPWNEKIPMFQNLAKEFNTAFDIAISSSIKSAKALNYSLTRNDLNSVVQTLIGKERVDRYKVLVKDVGSMMNKLQNGPVTDIGKLTDSVETFIDGFDDYDFGKIFLKNPMDLNDKLLEFKELTFTAGSILRDISNITRLCKGCNASSVFGNSFITKIAHKLETKFEQVGKNMSNIIDRAGTGLKGWEQIINTANTISSNFKNLKNSKNINSSIYEASSALLKSSQDIAGLSNGSSLIFKAIFNNNKDMDFLQTSFEGLVNKVGNILNKTSIALPKAGNVYVSLQNVKQMFNKISENFEDLNEGPVESRIEILREITKGVNGIGKSLVNTFNQSKETINALGIDSTWLQGVTEGMVNISHGISNVVNKSNMILDGAGMVTEDVRGMQTLVSGIKENFKEIQEAPLEHKFKIFNQAIEKVDGLLDNTNSIAQTIDTTLKNISGNDYGIGNTLGNITFKLSGMLGNISNAVKKIADIHLDIGSTIKAIKSGPIEKIGKLTDATKEFVKSLKNYDLSEILVLAPKFVRGRISDLKETIFESGEILKNISGLVTKHCKSCNFSSILGNGFVRNITEQIKTGLGNITNNVESVLTKVEANAGNIIGVIDSVKSIKDQFTRVKNLKFDQNSFETISDVLGNTANHLNNLQNNSATVFKSFFSENKGMVKLIGQYEGFLNRMNGFLITGSNFTKNVSVTIEKFTKLKDMFDTSKESFQNLTKGPIENRLEAVKNIVNVVNSVMLGFPDIIKTSPLSNQWLRGFGTQLEGLTGSISNVLNQTLDITNDISGTIGNIRDVQLTVSIIGNEVKRLTGSGSVGDKIRIANNIVNKVKTLTGQINTVASNASNIIEQITGTTLIKTDIFGNTSANILNQLSNGLGTVADRYEKFRDLTGTFKVAFENIKEDPVKFALEDLPKLFNQTEKFISLLFKDVNGIAKKIGLNLEEVELDKNLVSSAKAFYSFTQNTLSTIRSGAAFVRDFKNLLNSKDFKQGLTNLKKLADSGQTFLKGIDKLGASLFTKWGSMKGAFKNALESVKSSLGLNLKNMGSYLQKGLKLGGNALTIYTNIEYLINLKEFNGITVIKAANSIINIAHAGVSVLNEMGMAISTTQLEIAQQAVGYVTAIIQLYEGIKGFTEWLNDVCDITYEDVVIPKNLTYLCLKPKMFIESMKIPVEKCVGINKEVIRGYKEGKLCCPTSECVYTQDIQCLQQNEACVKSKVTMSKVLSSTTTRMKLVYQAYYQSSQLTIANEKIVKIHETLLKKENIQLQKIEAAFTITKKIFERSKITHVKLKSQLQSITSIVTNGRSTIKILSAGFDFTFSQAEVSNLPLSIKINYKGAISVVETLFDFKNEVTSLESSSNTILKEFVDSSDFTRRKKRSLSNFQKAHQIALNWVVKCITFNEIYHTFNELMSNLRTDLLRATTLNSRRTTGDNPSQKEEILMQELNEMKQISYGTVDEVFGSWKRSSEMKLIENIGSECNGLLDCFNAQIDNLTLLYQPELEGYSIVKANLRNIKTITTSILQRTRLNKKQVLKDIDSIMTSLTSIQQHTFFCDGSPVLTQPMRMSVYAYLDENFEMNCNIAGPASMKYIWRKDGLILPKQTSWKLELKDVSIDDQGYYTCEGKILDNSAISNKVLLQVFKAPVLLSQPKSHNLEYPGGKDITWVCNGTADPVSYYQWWFKSYSSGKPVLLSESSILKLRNVGIQNAGYYWCEISNGKSKIKSENVNLDITKTIPRKESARIHLLLTTSSTNNTCALPASLQSAELNIIIKSSLLQLIGLSETSLTFKYSKNTTNNHQGYITIDVSLIENSEFNGFNSVKYAVALANKRRTLQEKLNAFVETILKGEGLELEWKQCSLLISVLKKSIEWQAEDLVCPKGMGNSKNNLKCVQCSPGTFDNMKGQCSLCPIGTYQPGYGKTTCLPCGLNHLTNQIGTPDYYQCRKTEYVCNTPMNLLILMDSSTSKHEFSLMKQFVANFLKNIDLKNVRLSLALFANDVELKIVPGGFNSVMSQVSALSQLGVNDNNARLDSAYNFATKYMGNGINEQNKNVVLLLTKNGIMENQKDLINEHVQILKENDVELFLALLEQNDESVKEFVKMVSQPVESHLYNAKTSEIPKWATTTARAVC